ncbi:MAG TPA: flagellar M-ring protein FliF, partial [Caulobacteraceae bacterium]
RPLLRNATAGGTIPLLTAAGGGGGSGALSLMNSGGGEMLALPGHAGQADMEQRIDIAKIEGQVKVSSVRRVAEFVDKHPDESVSILRSWLHETA